MPLYEYRCTACGEAFEIISSFTERDEKAACPACGARGARRVFSPITLAGKRTSMHPQNFVRPHGPVTPPTPATPKKVTKR